jgi:hypothetical protein
MFAPHCPRHGRRVLLGYDDITAVATTSDGVTVDWTCFCGHHGRSRFTRGTGSVGDRARRLVA